MSGQLSVEQWTDYWSESGLTTFQRKFEENYDGRVKAFWQRQIARLPDDATILDLGTGNGALALLAAQLVEQAGRTACIVGVDSAAIDPQNRLPERYQPWLDRVRFLPGTRMEDTGLDTGGFDAVISQFGFEYGNPATTVAEVGRLLRPGGFFAAILHHEDSALIRQAHDSVEQVSLCRASGVEELVRRLAARLTAVRSARQDPADDQQCEVWRKELNSRLSVLQSRDASRFRDPAHIRLFIQNVMLPLNRSHRPEQTPEQKLDVLDRMNLDFDAFESRMRDLMAAALNDPQLEALAADLAQRGFQMERSEPFVYEGAHFGHALVARRE